MNFPKKLIREGRVKLFIPDPDHFRDSSGHFDPAYLPVFYNSRMVFCRDVSILAIQAFQKLKNHEISICDPLTATGVRGLRYAAEVGGVKNIVINDKNPVAVQLAIENLKMNKLNSKIHVECMDARLLFYLYALSKRRFDVIDLDPFGSPAPFIEAAIYGLKDGGMLCLTATDMAVLCGLYPKVCLRRYGSIPLRVAFCYELAIRIVAGYLAKKAAGLDFSIKILFSHGTDHYIRIYSMLERNSSKANYTLKNLGYIYYCSNCGYRQLTCSFLPQSHEKCPYCNSKLLIGGPLWCKEIVDKDFAEAMFNLLWEKKLDNLPILSHFLETILGEADGPPTFYVIDKLTSRLKVSPPPINQFIDRLKSLGFFASRTHFHPKGVRTNAPINKIYDVLSSKKIQ